ncbi:MAG: prenylated flavin chaperone LpdD [Chloroflexota bacterium]
MDEKSARRDLWRVADGEGRLRVEATAVRVGDDLVVAIAGGTAPHLGAVALALPRPSLKDKTTTSATSSVLTLLGHKDDVVAREAAERLAAALGCPVVVTAGLHVDDATAEDLAALVNGARGCVEALLAALRGKPPA